MLKIRTVFLFVILFAFLVGMFPSDETLDSDVDMFGVNILGQIISVKEHQLFLKTDESILKFENLSFGSISSLAADDALNIMLYYEDVQKILFLDNQLSLKRDPIDLYELDLASAKLSCLSYNTGFWVFNSATSALHRFDRFLNQTYSTGNLSTLVGKQVNPNSIKEAFNYLVMNDPKMGLLIFDRYGALLKEIPIMEIADIQINNDDLIFLRRDSVFRYQLQTFNIDTIEVILPNAIQFSLQGQQVFYLDKTGDLKKKSIND